MIEPVNPSADDEERVPSPSFVPKPPGPLRRFLMPPTHTTAHAHSHRTYPWYNVLWLTGVDYFSSLGYAPGIAFVAAGALAPPATLILVLVTLAGALPVYNEVAKRSYAGQGSIAMLEALVGGWKGKLLVLVMLGFAATGFVITMTLSASDAAKHAVENPLLSHYLEGHEVLVTAGLLALLAFVFLRGFSEAIGVAVLIGLPYIILNFVVIARCLVALAARPEVLDGWTAQLSVRGDTLALFLASALVFPKLALGMSGFETGVSVIPLVKGSPTDGNPPAERIRNARKLLLVAAVIMSVLLVGSSVVTTLLIPQAAFAEGGPASGRALAYLAHEYLGHGFGSIYDVATIAILWFAGASALVGMLNLIPRYLPRFGMAPHWVAYTRPLVLILLAIELIVVWAFKANVDAQGGAYATGVLALMLSAAFAVAIALWTEGRRARSLYFWLVTAVFAFAVVDNVIERPDGVIIAGLFVAGIILASAASRYSRAHELRVEDLHFVDAESRALFESLRGKKVNLVPVRDISDTARRRRKARHITKHFNAKGPLAFLHVGLTDDRSDFESELRARVYYEDDVIVIDVEGAVAIANVIAWISEQLDPIGIYLQLSLEHPFRQNLKYLFWGEGETALLVREVLVKYWHSTPEDDVRPLIFLVSE